ncbi:MAG: pyruvate ferredoxin oxidoreductase [Thermoprotei archaeon]|nr:MAG: pyruvate ferredoxin oxidoreductase [Thermoprotei archaeon]RLF25156.1 MAG: pyruvate ferredoxin oxidoreductase [Thermoprotei archaeon]
MAKVIGLTGDEAVAYAVKQCDVDVIAAYPITPQTVMVERLSDYVADGEIDAEFVPVESEHSALSVCVGASLTGARVFTATCSQGLALMHEILYIASALRCPIVMAIANRALSAPINIHCDHSDTLGSRDSGWIQIYTENVQEVYDSIIEAFRISEDKRVLLPTMVCLDGFILSHCMERVETLEDAEVKGFLLPKPEYPYPIDPERPMTYGPVALPDFYFEFKRQQEEAMKNARSVIREVNDAFAKLSGRKYDVIRADFIEDSDVVIMCMGSAVGTMRHAVRELRKEGLKVGLIKVRVYRPFPEEELRKALEDKKVVIAMDRACSPGAMGGPLYEDVCSLLYDAEPKPKVANVVYGLGGRDLTPSDAKGICKYALEILKTGIVKERIKFVGVRE